MHVRTSSSLSFWLFSLSSLSVLSAAVGARAQVPLEWACNDAFYDAGDGCDCGCDVADPDCTSAGRDVCKFDNCGSGAVPSDVDNLRCVPNVCGDHYKDETEACDDGDAVDGGGCAAGCDAVEQGFLCAPRAGGCRETTCGDRVRQTGEECDDGNQSSGDGCDDECQGEAGFVCRDQGIGVPSFCSATVCGDFFVEYDIVTGTGERCDDGNQLSGDGCTPTCEVEDGFFCDPWFAQCVPAVCGNGSLDGDLNRFVTEWCDDGNTADDDGCDRHCLIEAGFDCPTPGELCTPAVCGDGVVSVDNRFGLFFEQCDDGNSTSGDGCSADCSFIEPGFICPEPGELCHPPVCGDLSISPPEDCEDGNTDDGDGCSSTCRTEPGFGCVDIGEPCFPIPDGWDCPAFVFGTDDGCDCGCGAQDSDCPDDDVNSCQFNHCFDFNLPDLDPDDPTQCTNLAGEGEGEGEGEGDPNNPDDLPPCPCADPPCACFDDGSSVRGGGVCGAGAGVPLSALALVLSVLPMFGAVLGRQARARRTSRTATSPSATPRR